MTTNQPLVQNLQRRIQRAQISAGVIGLGYVGLPLAVEFARAGYTVVVRGGRYRRAQTV